MFFFLFSMKYNNKLKKVAVNDIFCLSTLSRACDNRAPFCPFCPFSVQPCQLLLVLGNHCNGFLKMRVVSIYLVHYMLKYKQWNGHLSLKSDFLDGCLL